MRSTGISVAVLRLASAFLLGGLLLTACASDPTPKTETPIVSLPAGDLRSELEAGGNALDAGDLAASERHYRAAIAIAPEAAEAHLGLGNVLVRQGKLAEAEAAYGAALARDPKLVAAQANLGVVYYQQEDFARAAPAFESVLKRQPDDPQTLYLLAAVRIQEKNLIEGEKLLNRARDLAPDLPEVYYGLGVLYKLKGQKAEAIAAFEKFLAIGPGQDPAAKGLAEAELRDLRGQ